MQLLARLTRSQQLILSFQLPGPGITSAPSFTIFPGFQPQVRGGGGGRRLAAPRVENSRWRPGEEPDRWPHVHDMHGASELGSKHPALRVTV